VDDDQFPLDKPELAIAAYERFKRTQDASVVRDLVRSLKMRESQIAQLTAQRDQLLKACRKALDVWGRELIDDDPLTEREAEKLDAVCHLVSALEPYKAIAAAREGGEDV
jgi:DNA polymerase III psi subunit